MSENKIRILVPAKIIDMPSREYKASASFIPKLQAQPDLLYMKSILVSTGANKNDDVFLKEELWAARATPVLKPVDWEHNTGRELTDDEIKLNPGQTVAGNQIIGVMYNAYVNDKNGVIIDEDKTSATDFEIPESFHIIDEAVIYKGLYPKTAARIEEGAAKDELFVSMETYFASYDYLIGNKVIARNEETAFLEPKLKANGGDGIFGTDKIKRVLRNLTFGGKGIVTRPANEPSVIQTITHEPISASSAHNKAIASNVLCDLEDTNIRLNLMEDSDMANPATDTKVAPVSGPSFDDYKEVTQELANTRTELKTTAGELKTVSEQRDELDTQNKNVKSALAKGGQLLEEALPGISEKLAKADVSEVFDVIADAVKAKGAEASEKVSEAEKKATEATTKLAEAEANVRANERLSRIQSELSLTVKDGDTDDVTRAKVSQAQTIANDTKELNDEAFDTRLKSLKSLLSLAADVPFPPKKKGDKDKDKKDKKKENASEGITDASILDAIKATDNAPASTDDASVGVDLDKAYAGLVDSMMKAHAPKKANKDN